MMIEPDIDLPWLVAFVLNEFSAQPELEPQIARLRVLEQQRTDAAANVEALAPSRAGNAAWLSLYLLSSDRVLRLLLLEIRLAANMRDVLRGLE